MSGERIFAIIFLSTYILDLLLIISVVFLEKKNYRSMITWVLFFLAFPYVAWFFYIMLGQGPRFSKKRWSKKKLLADALYTATVEDKLTHYDGKDKNDDIQKIIALNQKEVGNKCTSFNDVDIFVDANKMYKKMIEDMKNAKKSINLLSYIYRPDAIGKEIRDVLVLKAREGVKVKVCFDDNGNLKTPYHFFKELRTAGGEFFPFFPSLIRGISFNFNYRNHRKICVIDGEIGYVGGMNIGEEYMGKHRRITPWRDTHIRLVGEAVNDLQKRFLQDYYYARQLHGRSKKEFEIRDDYFTQTSIDTFCPVQIISSGPQAPSEPIKDCYERMILGARKEVYIQTPYFIPDNSFFNSLIIAQHSGVQIHLMIPGIYDQRFPYRVTCSFMKELLDAGVKVYKYNGFIHAKTMVMDNQVLSIGSANMDVRSFALNFEVNAVIYNKEKAKEYIEIFKEDIKNSIPYTLDLYKKRKWYVRFEERLFRIFAAIM